MYKILVTGSTGTLGNMIVRLLNKQLTQEDEIICLVRADSQEDAQERFYSFFGDVVFVCEVTIIVADLVKENVGIEGDIYNKLSERVTHILHLAASTRFDLTLSEARLANVYTTEQVLNFAKRCGNMQRFAHVSTAFVAGRRQGTIYESELEHDKGFLNTYEQSKYEAEKLVHKYGEEIPFIIFRPSLVQTEKRSNAVNQPQNAVTMVQYLIAKNSLPVLPGNKDEHIDIISGEVVAKTINCIFLKKELDAQVFHITGCDKSPTIQQIIAQSITQNEILFAGDIESYYVERDKVLRERSELVPIYEKIEIFLLELAYPKTFDNTNVIRNCKKSKI